MYDSIIIGTGPAGLSAALNLKTYKKDFIWFGSKNLSEKVQKAEKITNYPGFPQISGQELFERFDAHRRAAGIDITEKTIRRSLRLPIKRLTGRLQTIWMLFTSDITICLPEREHLSPAHAVPSLFPN